MCVCECVCVSVYASVCVCVCVVIIGNTIFKINYLHVGIMFFYAISLYGAMTLIKVIQFLL